MSEGNQETSKTTILGEDVSQQGQNTTDQTSQSQEGSNTADQQSSEQSGTDFTGQAEQAEQQATDYLNSLVGEGRKYKSVEDLAKAYANADPYISELKEKVNSLEGELSKAKTVEDIMGLLGKEEQPATQNTQQTTEDSSGNTIPLDKLDEWYEQRRQSEIEKEQEQQEVERVKQTQQQSWELLDKTFGDREKAKQIVNKAIADDPTVGDVINKLGSYSPEKLVAFVQSISPASESVSFTDDVKSSVGAFPDGVEPSKLTWSQCKKVKKENPRLFKTQKFQAAMNQAAGDNPNFYTN